MIKTWRIKRWIIEEGESFGNTREEAVQFFASNPDVSTVTVTKETCVLDKEQTND